MLIYFFYQQSYRDILNGDLEGILFGGLWGNYTII